MLQQIGLHNGIAIPLHGPRGEMAVVLAASGAAMPALEPGRLDYAELLSRHFYKIFLRLERKAEITEIIALTERERQVLALCATGKSQAEVASALSVTKDAVKYHMKGILFKLEARNQEVAVMKATAIGLISRRYIVSEEKK